MKEALSQLSPIMSGVRKYVPSVLWINGSDERQFNQNRSVECVDWGIAATVLQPFPTLIA